MNIDKPAVTRRDFWIGGTALMAGGLSFGPRPTRAADTATPGTKTMESWTSGSPFLARAFAPVFDERDDADLTITGELPAGLQGVFMRNGPNPQFKPDDHYAYPFDGTGMIHAIYMQNGRARYRNRWVLTQELAAERTVGHRIFNSGFSAPPPSKRLELHRQVIHTDTNTVEDQTIDDQACEFGRINDAYLGRKARYGYVGLRDRRPGEAPQIGAFEAIARYDLATGEKVVHRFPAGVTVCEPVFVADPHGKQEEDGFIFTFAHEAGSPTGSFIILDARDLTDEPLALIRLPRRVPAGLHGSWIPA